MREKMTIQKLEAAIAQGRGIGELDRYRPWITITRSGTSKTSNQSFVRMPCLSRHCCFLSRAERQMAHVLWWVGAEDVREQYPLWPWAHPSPYRELDRAGEWQNHPGIASVAKDAGIRLFNYPGLSIPAILTIDLLVTARVDAGSPPTLIGISCKPKEAYLEAVTTSRLRERLELDRRYCATASISHLLVHPEQLPVSLVSQLEWLAPRATRCELDSLRGTPTYQRFTDRLRKDAYGTSASRAIDMARRKAGWDKKTATRIARTAIWFQDVDVDLLSPIVLYEPLRPGGIALRSEVRRRLFGEAQQCH